VTDPATAARATDAAATDAAATDAAATDAAATDAAATDLEADANALIAELAGPGARIRDDQLTAVRALLDGRRALVVQRTGWGKTAVYLVATALARRRGDGPTLLVSPLLALMRDQLGAAARIGVRAATINSSNIDRWAEVEADVAADAVDLLLISPERLNHPGFRQRVWPALVDRVGLVVIDEAHCISDWGHDFRPDYRRIKDVLADLTGGDRQVGVLATTATANDRVVEDVESQLGADPLTLRGGLDRTSLHLAVHRLDAAGRLAWLAAWIPTTVGSGIVYCLTVADTELVASFLSAQGIDAVAYSGALEGADREDLEGRLKGNDVKVVVATSALGMGFDKPDLSFVVHHGLPSSPVAYYQAIGRAGRGVDRADVIGLPGEQDEEIWRYFESASMPRPRFVDRLLEALGSSDQPTSLPALEVAVNAGRSRLDAALRILDVDGAVERVEGGWRATGTGWRPDAERLDRVAAGRAAEAGAMRRYSRADACLMHQLLVHLDDPHVDEGWTCGRCQVCDPDLPTATADPPADLVQAATTFLRTQDVVLEPRRTWPPGLAGRRGRIGPDRQAAEGRALARGTDPGWDDLVRVLLADGAAPGDPAVDAALDEVTAGLTGVLARWGWAARPTWVTWVPSRRRPWLVEGLAARLAELGRLPLVGVMTPSSGSRPPQAQMDNSAHAAAGALAAVQVDAAAVAAAPAGPTLLVDDVRTSGWTLTVAAEQLRAAGADAVLPVVLLRRF
jgi:ATP-dependent DNA helicase RecQ